ncbi:MAG: YcaO-like family protein [Candidatus Margulisbacteria bacterium]|nr:YcaO-like family protein [Candidatus Margulisiibacteriota bacterium]
MVNFILREQTGFELESVKKSYIFDQDKFVHPKVTFKKAYRNIMRNITDRSPHLLEIRADHPIFVYDFGDGTVNSHGKGFTIDQAKASAIMEYSERYSWLNYDYKNVPGYKHLSFSDLNKEFDLSRINNCFFIPYSDKKEYLLEYLRNINMDWVPGYSLTHKCAEYYPLNWNNNYQTSNGLCTGNTKEEAIVQGICEVIERHNTGYVVMNKEYSAIELIDINSINHPAIHDLYNYYKRIGIDIYLFNASKYINVPTILCSGIDHRTDKEILRKGFGYGCHTDPNKAIIRAITEYTQGREGIVLKQDIVPSKFKLTKGRWQFCLDMDVEKCAKECKVIPVSALNNLSSDDFREEIYSLMDLLNEQNLNTIVIDKSHPKLKVPVYRVYIPGLLPINTISSMNQNDDLIVLQLLVQDKKMKEAQQYYTKNFRSLLKNMESFLSLGINMYMAETGQNFRQAGDEDVVLNLVNSMITPDKLPLEQVVHHGNYLDQIKYYMAVLRGDIPA